MEAAIDASTPLDYIEFQIVPSQNRYEAWVCYENKKEKVSFGHLEQLLQHTSEIKALHSKGSNAKYKLCAPENSHDIEWFTKSTLIRFLHVIGSADILDITNSLKNEISQLEEARVFHLSLYAKGSKYPPESVQSDDSFSEGTGSTTKEEGSDASKNELLRAMDVRLAALRGELTTAFDQAAGLRYSLEEMMDIYKFSQHFGSKDLSDSLRKYIELRQGDQSVENTSSSKEVNNRANGSLSSETQVKYGVSPAKVAQVERQSSIESDKSSLSSDEDRQPSAERSRSLMRSASPRRSASPMRRVQIGRSGSRKSTAITIKSLNYFPAREKSFFPKDEDDSGEEPEKAPKKSEHNVRRMSVQDAINLFESKQRDQRGDTQKAKSLLNANKSVLRRWSSGMGEDSSNTPRDSSVQGAEVQINVENTEVRLGSPDFEDDPDVVKEDYPNNAYEKDVELEQLENGACSPVLMQEEPRPTFTTDVTEKPNASADWNRQKEAELNELFMKMMETKPVKNRTVLPASSKRQSLLSEKKDGFYHDHKEKRGEKLKIEGARNSTEKEKQSKSTQQILDVKKSKPNSKSASDDGKKRDAKKIQKPQKSNVSQPRTEKSPKLGIVKKETPNISSLPATRKSWSSIPARATGMSPAKTPPPTSTTNATPTRRRSQTPPPPPVSHSSSKVEKTQTRANSVKSNQNDSKKSLKNDSDKKQLSLTKHTKTAKNKVVQTAPKDLASSTKPKGTKKSSVVPLESKPFLRKSSKATSVVNPSVIKNEASQSQEPLRKSEDLTPTEENVTSLNFSEPVTHQEEKETEELKIDEGMQLGLARTSPQNCENEEFSQISPTINEAVDRLVEPELKSEDEDELTISPRAWVEIEENENHLVTSVDHNEEVAGSSEYIAPVEVSNPRVHHSLSQMLLEESSEPDFVNWGNAENPQPMVYQKDAPKGLKRLLKFARKSKNEANATGWSNHPSVLSEGEDDGDDSKLTSKRSVENLPRKSTLHSMNNGHQKSSTDYEHPDQANTSKLNTQSTSQLFQQGVSASVTTIKATRSFFSLSAFKGSK